MGTGVNAAAGLMAVLGNCPGTAGSTGDTFSPGMYVVVNEVSTVAAAYAMAGFATDATHVGSSGTAAAQLGIQDAFATAASLSSLPTGVALAITPHGNGSVPQTEVNTLANVLAACVNSAGAGSTACSTLFSNAESAGSSGTTPTDTATAAVNIAHNPGSNIAALYGLSTANPPFGVALSAQPNDFTLAIQYVTNAADTATIFNSTVSLAIDQYDNVWIANSPQNNIEEVNAQGVPYSYSPMTNSCTNCVSITTPNGLAIDSQGNAWIAGSMVFALCANGGTQCSSVYGYLSNPTYGEVNVNFFGVAGGLAFDGTGNLWMTNENSGSFFPDLSLTELIGVGTSTSGTLSYENYQVASRPEGVAVDAAGDIWLVDNRLDYLTQISPQGAVLTSVASPVAPTALAIDQTGNVWVIASGFLNKFNSNGIMLAGNPGFYYGSRFGANAVAVDGANHVWVTSTDNGSTSSLGEFTNSGTYVGPTTNTGYLSSGMLQPHGVAIDQSGNVWIGNQHPTLVPGTAYYGAITKFVGLATPVLTPLYLGAQNRRIAAEP
jgi:sugar lactone lactonase YvrE